MTAAFEFNKEAGVVWLSLPLVDNKTRANQIEAVQEILIGLARIKAGFRFFKKLRAGEQKKYSAFFAEWLSKCEEFLV